MLGPFSSWRVRLASGAAVGLIAATLVAPRARLSAAPLACPPVLGPTVLVDTGLHTLALCEPGAPGVPAERFHVRLGRAGVGKQREGDGRTPLGRYDLGPPRPSTSFGTFVPVAYPTDAQRRQGFTGGAVGIHGPHRFATPLGRLANLFDSTEGCVGVATDAEVARIATWLRALGPAEIVLR